jgi:ferric-dicitrate binding protein FerR (iron transport regulator)
VLANEATEADKETLVNWRNSSAENELYAKQLEAIWQNANESDADIDVNAAWNKVEPRLKTQAPIFKLNTLMKIAASVTLVFTIGLVLFKVYVVNTDFTTITANNEKQKVVLPDGSIAWLNKNSVISFSNNQDKERNVILNGEAFFEVVKNPEKPFIITSKNAVTQVLGTSFNLIAFDTAQTVKLSVATGKVSFKSTKTNLMQIVTANEAALINSTGLNNKLSQFDINEITWKENKLIFNDVPLTEAIKSIEHYYGVSISVNNPLLNNCHVTCEFNNVNLAQVLDDLSKILSISYSKNNNDIALSGKGCN